MALPKLNLVKEDKPAKATSDAIAPLLKSFERISKKDLSNNSYKKQQSENDEDYQKALSLSSPQNPLIGLVTQTNASLFRIESLLKSLVTETKTIEKILTSSLSQGNGGLSSPDEWGEWGKKKASPKAKGKPGGKLAKLGKFAKVAAPLAAAGLVLYENSDELLETGKIDPMKQVDKTMGGLGDMFDTEAPLLSMKRVTGALDAVSGATGAVLGVGTQIGDAIRKEIPTEFFDKVFSGFGLFGKTQEEVMAENEAKYKKDMEERKKKKEEESKKKETPSAATAVIPPVAVAAVPAVVPPAKDDVQKTKQDLAANVASSSVQIIQPATTPIPVYLTDSKGKELIDPLTSPGAEAKPQVQVPIVVSAVSGSPPIQTPQVPVVPSPSIAPVSTPPVEPPAAVQTQSAIPSMVQATNAAKIQDATNAATPGPVQTPQSQPPKGPAFLGWAKESVKNEFIKRGYPPEKAEIFSRGAAAQLVQEVGWDAGSKQVGQNNFFNIKETSKIKGDVEGKRAYDKAEGSNDVYAGWSTPEKGIAGYVDFLTKNPRYAKAGVFNSNSSEEYAQSLQKAGFATDPNYAKNITSIMNGKKLNASIDSYSKTAQSSIAPETSQPVASVDPPSSDKRTVGGSYTSSSDDKKYFSGDLSKLNGMDPVFIEKLKAASTEAGVVLPLTSGFRSQEKQDQLRADAVKKYGSEEAASKWVAKTSIHTTGNAADFSMGGDAKKFWDSNPALVKAMEKQGLHRPLAHEAWHWESDITKGESRKGLAAKLIKQRSDAISGKAQPQAPQIQQPATPSIASGQGGDFKGGGASGSFDGTLLPAKGMDTKKDVMKSVYNSFINAGFSDAQSKALTAEAGRENSFNTKTIFGSHTDAANAAKNIGYFSWQGKRAEQLQKRLEDKGLWKDGKAVQSQETLDEMARFAKGEMQSGQYKGLGNFLENKDVDSETAAKQLGKGYIKWAYGQDKLSSGASFDWKSHDNRRAGYYNEIDSMVKKGGSPASAQTPSISEVNTPQVSPPKEDKGIVNAIGTSAGEGVAKLLNQQNAKPAALPTVDQNRRTSGTPTQSQGTQSSGTLSPTSRPSGGVVNAVGTSAGEAMARLLNQQNAKPAALPTVDQNRARGGGNSKLSNLAQERLALEQASAVGNQDAYNRGLAIHGEVGLARAVASNTISGMTPSPLTIPNAGTIPTSIQSLSSRAQQNYNLSQLPVVKATIAATQPSTTNLSQIAQSLGVDPTSGIGQSIGTVESLRNNGVIQSLMGGDIPTAISRINPTLSGTISGLTSSIGSLVNAVPMNALSSLTNGSVSAASLTSSMPLISNALEEAGSVPQSQSEQQITPMIAGGSPSSPIGGARQTGVEVPLDVRNNESSIRRLTDALLGYGFS